MTRRVTRLSPSSIIHPGLCKRIGTNINGPSLIAVPEWIENPLGAYYLYFAHHKGRYIRLAYSDTLQGPWSVYEPGVIDVADSLFVAEDLEELSDDHAHVWPAQASSSFLYAHVASPDVHVDHDAKIIRMYFHGLLDNADQQTRVSYSHDGLSFEPLTPILGPPYFRAFEYGRFIYAIAWGGALLRAPNWDGPFEEGPSLLMQPPLVNGNQIVRHVAVHRRANSLDLYYTRIGDNQESILCTQVELAADWRDWQAGEPTVVLKPELEWEGANLPLQRSAMGAVSGPENALRDPCVFVENEKIYLLYSGAGECGIGLAEITSR